MKSPVRMAIALVVVAGFVVGGYFLFRGEHSSKITLQLNWKPEPEFGGFYAAADNGDFAREGLDVEVKAGGPGTPTVQMVGSGNVDFAIVSADQVVMARAQGNDVVALFAVYQDCPQGLMTRASRGFTTVGDIFKNPGAVAMEKGLPYAQLLEKTYGFDKVKIVPTPAGGSLTQFQQDPNFTQQCFITSEPLAAKKAGIETKTFLIKESGYNPYTTVLATRGDLVRKDPKQVLAMVKACKAGWETYLKDPSRTNANMAKLNAGMDPDTFTASAEIQKPLILGGDAGTSGVGVMTLARWETLVKQLADLKVVEKAPPAGECFVDMKALEAAAAAAK